MRRAVFLASLGALSMLLAAAVILTPRAGAMGPTPAGGMWVPTSDRLGCADFWAFTGTQADCAEWVVPDTQAAPDPELGLIGLGTGYVTCCIPRERMWSSEPDSCLYDELSGRGGL